MSELGLIAEFFLGFSLLGLVLFFMVRHFYRHEIENDSKNKVTLKYYAMAALVSVTGVTLFYLAFKGSAWAAWLFSFAIALFLLSAAKAVISTKARK